MKKIIALLLILAMTATYLPAGNVVAADTVSKEVMVPVMSTGFEEADQSSVWDAYGTDSTRVDTVYYGDTGHSVKLSATGHQAQIKNGLSMVSGTTYTVSFWYKCEGASSLKMRIGARGGQNDFWHTGYVLDEGNNGWTKFEYTGAAIANQTYIDLYLSDGTGTVYVDNVSVSKKETHNVQKVEAAEPTHLVDGNVEYWKCVDSGYESLLWADEACTIPTTLDAVTIPKFVPEEKVILTEVMSTGFEEADQSSVWGANGTGATRVDTVYQGASGHSVKLSATGHQAQIKNGLSMVSGTTYTVSFWYKCEGASSLKMRIGARGGTNDFWDTGYVLDEGNNGWTKFEYTGAAIANQTYIDLYLSGGTGTVYVDNVSVSKQMTHNVLHVEAKEATTAEDGNYEYWYCVDDGCGKVWSDADCTVETTLEAVTIPKLVPVTKSVAVPVMSTGFEEADQSSVWGANGTGATRVDTVYYGDTGHSVKLSATGHQAQIKNGLSMVSGTTYTVSFWYKCEGASGLKMRIGVRGGQNDFWETGYVLDEGNNGWTKFEYTGAAIANQTYIDLYLSGGAGTVYVDNVSVTKQESHTVLRVPAKAATATSTGNVEYWKCVDTGYENLMWSDEACTQLTTLEEVTTPMLAGHTHVPIHVPAVEATLELTGNIECWYCSETSCGKLFLDESCTQETTLDAVTTPKLVPMVSNHSDDAPLSHYAGTVLKREDFEDESSDQVTKRGNGSFDTANQVYKVSGSSVADDMNTYAFTAEKDHTYRMAFYIWVEEASTDYQFDARLVKGSGYVASPASDNIAGPLMAGVSGYTATIDGVSVNSSIGTDTEKNKWQLVEITWTESVGQSLRAAFRTYAGSGTLYIDDFVISDITEKDKGPSAELELTKITRVEGAFELWFTGSYPKNTTTTPYRSYVNILVNGKTAKLNFKHEANSSEILYAYVSSSAATLKESGVNTIVIPAGSVWNKDTDAGKYGAGGAEFHIESDYTFYTEKVAGNWMDWSSDYEYPEGKDVQYVDIGTGKDYVFSNTTSTLDGGAEGVMAVTKDGAVVYSSSNDGSTPSYTTKEVGVYEVVRTVGRERYQYQVVLYKRGNTHSALASGESADKLDARDLVALVKAVDNGSAVGLQQYKAADSNVDGVVNNEDASFMRRVLAGEYNIMTTQKGQTIFEQGTMPIVGHGGVDPATTDASVMKNIYQYMGEAGINLFITPEVFSNSTVKTQYSEPALRYADTYGLKLMLKEPLVANEDKSEAQTVTDDTLVKRAGQHNMYNSFAGLYVADEPTYSTTALAGGITKYAIDNYASALQTTGKYTNIHSYLNLFPQNTTVTNVSNNYQAYLTKALSNQAEMLCYDMYYVSNYTEGIFSSQGHERLAESFYKNLATIRANSGNTPFWTYVQAGTDFGTDNGPTSSLPTRAELYFEANAALAMGAKGINYFRVVRGADYESTTNGLLTSDGQKVTNPSLGDTYNYYDIATDINTYIAKIDHVLMNATNMGVIAKNSTTKGYISNAAIDSYNGTTVTAGADAFVGCFDYYGKDVYLVCNTNTSAAQTITLNFGKNVAYKYTGMNCTTVENTGNSFSLSIPAGESVLVEVK